MVCTAGTLGAGATAKYLVAVQVADVASGTVLTNTVVATTATSDPNSANNTATHYDDGAAADRPERRTWRIAKRTALTSVTAGERITYTLTVTNAGPAAATNVRVLELVPAGATVVSLTPVNPDSAGAYCNLGGACWLGTVYPTTTATIQVVLDVNSDFSGGSLVNTAQVSADQRDPDQGDNFASVTTPVSTAADLVVGKADLVDPAYAGGAILYQVVVTNTGPSDAAGRGHHGHAAGGRDLRRRVGVLQRERRRGDVPARRPGGRRDDGGAHPGAGSRQPGAGHGRDEQRDGRQRDAATRRRRTTAPSAATTVNQPVGGLVDLRIGKDATATVVAGRKVTYTLVVTNAGPAVARDVTVVDALPVELTVLSVTASQGTCSGGVTCLLGDLAVNATATVTIVATVDSATPAGSLLNTARAASANPDSDPAQQPGERGHDRDGG